MKRQNQGFGEIFRVQPPVISVRVGAASIAFSTFAIILFGFNWVDRDIIRFAVSTVAAAAGITSAFYVGEGIRRNLDYRKEDLDAKKADFDAQRAARKAERAMAYISAWTHPSFAEIRKAGREIRARLDKAPKGKETQIIKQALDEDHNLEQDIVTILNFLEEIALSVESELVDEKIIRGYFSLIINRYCDVLGLWIAEERKHRSDELYSSLLRLHARWKTGHN